VRGPRSGRRIGPVGCRVLVTDRRNALTQSRAASTSVTSDRLTKVRPSGTAVPQPKEVTEEELGACDFALNGRIEEKSGIIANKAGLYKPDVNKGEDGGPKAGFDCDDAASAWAANFMKGGECCTFCPPGCLQVSVLNVSWTNKKGQGVGHRVVKVVCCGNYWLVDPQSGNVTGPYDSSVLPNAWDLLVPRYTIGPEDIDTSKNVTTNSREIPPEERGGTEPPPWHTDPEVVEHFEQKTGEDAEDFKP